MNSNQGERLPQPPLPATQETGGEVEDTKETLQRILLEIDRVAVRYAEMAPGQKPSYLGILLVLGAIGFELAEPFVPLMTVPNEISMTMLIGGLVSLAVGSALDALVIEKQAKLLHDTETKYEQELREVRGERRNLWKWFSGRRS